MSFCPSRHTFISNWCPVTRKMCLITTQRCVITLSSEEETETRSQARKKLNVVEFTLVTTFLVDLGEKRWDSINRRRRCSLSSDPIGHHPGVEFQEERLQLTQLALFVLLLLLTVPALFVHSLIFPLLILFFVHPGHPGSTVQAGIGSGVIGRKINRHSSLVIVGESGQQPLDHVWSLVSQVLPLARVGRDVEQPDTFVGGVLVVWRDVTFKVPPAARQSGQHLEMEIIYVIRGSFKSVE